MNIADDLAVEAKIHAGRVGGAVVSGVKEFGADFFKQMIGAGRTPPLSDEEIAKKKEADDEFSNNAYRNAVEAMYSERRSKRQQEEQMRQQKEVQVKEKTMDELNHKRQMRADVAAAVGKGSAETGRSWGAE